jgi:septal ring factor EnvC (AmiA/AmiB activator)
MRSKEEQKPETEPQEDDPNEMLVLLRQLHRAHTHGIYTDFIGDDWDSEKQVAAWERRLQRLSTQVAEKWTELHVLESRIKEREAYWLDRENEITQKLAELDALAVGIENLTSSNQELATPESSS